MTKLQRNLLAAALGVALFSSTAMAQKGKKGGGDSNPDMLPIIADFQGRMQTDAHPDGPYSKQNLGTGWSEMPGTGNYTLQLDGSGRNLQMYFIERLDGDGSFPYDNDGGLNPAVVTLHLSMNRICSKDAWVGEACNTSDTSEGSLKAMKAGDEILVDFRSTFPDPANSKASLKIHCGPSRNVFDPDLEALNPSEPILATCMEGRLSDQACLRWELTPLTDDGILECRALRRTSSRNSFTYEDLGIYNMPFTLILQRDENGDGLPD